MRLASVRRFLIGDRVSPGARAARTVLELFLTLACGMFVFGSFPSPAVGGPVDDAKAAQRRGDLATAAIVNRGLTNRGDPEALYHLGIIYRYGRGVERNYDEAFQWFERAANLGSPSAQYSLADMYLRGLGARQDLRIAAKWYSRAAEQGHAQAQFVLGIQYKLGGGVTQSYGRAASWLKRAAGQGHGEAQYELGLLYFSGRGVDKDIIAACKWLMLAVRSSTRDKVRNAARSVLQDLKSRMTDGQYIRAQREANAWQAIPEGGAVP